MARLPANWALTCYRHGIWACILSRNGVTGQLILPHCGPTRTEADFLAHVQAVAASDPSVHR